MLRWTPMLLLVLGLGAAPAAAQPLPDQAKTAAFCLMEHRSMDCIAAFASAPEWREAVACVLRGEGANACLGIEAGLVGACAIAGGGSLEATAGCVALRLAAREAAKCVEGGVGEAGGCLGPGHELRRWGRAAEALGLRARDWWAAR